MWGGIQSRMGRIGIIGLRLSFALLLAGLARPASAQAVVADLSDHLIAVTTGFAGTKLLLFGAIEGDAADVLCMAASCVHSTLPPLHPHHVQPWKPLG